jgi:transposase
MFSITEQGGAHRGLTPLPSKSPELNPVENIWQFMRDNWLSNRVFKSYDVSLRPRPSALIC